MMPESVEDVKALAVADEASGKASTGIQTIYHPPLTDRNEG